MKLFYVSYLVDMYMYLLGFQVTVECAERGELLANLRKRYADLLDRIPRQVKRYIIVSGDNKL